MKFLVQCARVLTGLLFIFSGIVKLNDPAGFSLKLNEYFDVFAKDASTTQDYITISISKDGQHEASRSFQLYKKDVEDALSVVSTTQSHRDTAGLVTAHDLNVTVKLRNDEVGGLEYHFTDSINSGFFAVKADIAGKSVFQSDFHPSVARPVEFHKKIDLRNYVKPESPLVAFFTGFKKHSLWLSILFCALDVILGFALFVGWNIRFTSWMLLLIILFFTFLTGYTYLGGYCPSRLLFYLSSGLILFTLLLGAIRDGKMRKMLGLGLLGLTTACVLLCIFSKFCFSCAFDVRGMKVADCGCFGDFIRLKPWQSFYKDLILLLFILIIFFGAGFIKPWFSKRFGWKFMSVITVMCVGFGLYCYFYLPVWDFLPYKKGNNIARIMSEVPKGRRTSDSIHMTYVMHKGDDSQVVHYVHPYTEYMKLNEGGWTTGRRIDKVVVEGYKSPIYDFAIRDAISGEDKTREFLTGKGYQLVWINTFVGKGYTWANPEISEIENFAQAGKVKFWALTASGPDATEPYIKKHKLPFGFYNGDEKMLRTMARYDPTLYLFKGATVKHKWSGRNLPSVKKLEKLMR